VDVGGLARDDFAGTAELHTVNGGIHVETTNGGLKVEVGGKSRLRRTSRERSGS
jgi:hypothetical protein